MHAIRRIESEVLDQTDMSFDKTCVVRLTLRNSSSASASALAQCRLMCYAAQLELKEYMEGADTIPEGAHTFSNSSTLARRAGHTPW